jgi:hypothetical protein
MASSGECRNANLLFVGFKRQATFFERLVDVLEGSHTMAAEIVGGVLQILFGLFQVHHRRGYFGMLFLHLDRLQFGGGLGLSSDWNADAASKSKGSKGDTELVFHEILARL